MASLTVIILAIIGATLPILVTQASIDPQLRVLGRSVLIYAIGLPLALVTVILAPVMYFI